MADELLQLVDRQGNPVGAAPRKECHGNPALIQAVVHLYVFDSGGRLYVQKRAATKDTFPGRWDTSVGGHMSPGETPEQALRREAREELGIEVRDPVPLGSYLFDSETETEYVRAFRLEVSGNISPNPEEIEEGGFFSLQEIERRMRDNPEAFTPHFRTAFRRLLLDRPEQAEG